MNKPIKIVSIVGTRPEAIKMAPVVKAIKQRPHLMHRLIATGQQESLFDEAIAIFDLTVDRHLGHHPGGDMKAQIAKIIAAVKGALMSEQPDIILVQGDTNTALAAARASAECGIAVGHVEAGLRSHDLCRPFPEEQNRIEIAQLATLHFAPSMAASTNLKAEGITTGISITGNPGIDALMLICKKTLPTGRKAILVTCHRRENFGAPLINICNALRQIAEDTGEMIIFPVHPNPNIITPVTALLDQHPLVNLIAPLSYIDMITAIQQSRFVISDSGGLQEECAALGVPLLLLRSETERPEVISSGNAIIVGSDSNRIVEEAHRLISNNQHYAAMSCASFPYGKGDAAPRIVDAIEQHFTAQR